MVGPFKVRVTAGAMPLVLDIDADSFALGMGCVAFYQGSRIVHVVGLEALIDMTGELEPEDVEPELEPDVEPELEPEAPTTPRGGLYL
jgi:hypothetical protein